MLGGGYICFKSMAHEKCGGITANGETYVEVEDDFGIRRCPYHKEAQKSLGSCTCEIQDVNSLDLEIPDARFRGNISVLTERTGS